MLWVTAPSLMRVFCRGCCTIFVTQQITFLLHCTRQGTYLLLEKCKTVCYRNLFKRIFLILDKHQLSLNYIAKSLKWLGMPIDLDEVECILANLIYRGYIRGYLSHAKRVLVLSKREPFPTSAVIL
jgi:nuclear mRNA export protein PCID2/THP1